MKKFIIDTNVVIADPNFINKFEKNEIYIPLVVIQELDGLKKGQDEKGRNAREFTRILDKLRGKGNLLKGVSLKNGGKIFVIDIVSQDSDYKKLINDDLIIFTAKHVGGIVVSKDLNVRIKSDAWEVPAEDYKAGKLKLQNSDEFKGNRIIRCSADALDSFRKNGLLSMNGDFPNEYFIIKEDLNDKNSALGRYSVRDNGIVPLITPLAVWGVTPRNAEQRFALDALLNEDIKLVSLLGKAGTGKTLLVVAASLCKTLEESLYKRILISRPIIPMGKDLGYLPGDINEKLDPWMAPIYDNLDYLFGTNGGTNQQWKQLVEQDIIKIEAITYIRGRSIPNQFLIVDEAQNLSSHEIKTIITRAGEGTKIVLTGDVDQIDNPYLDSINNGLIHATHRMRDEQITAHIELTKGERSELADIGAELL